MKRSGWGFVLLAAALLAAPRAARADDAEKAAPAGEKVKPAPIEGEVELHYPPPSTRWKVLTAGLVLTGGAWGISYAMAVEFPYVDPSLQPKVPTATTPLISSGPPEGPWLKVPIAGPWIALGKMGCASDEPSCGVNMGFRVAGYIFDGIVQLAGLALITEGIVMKTEEPAAPKSSAFTFRRGDFALSPAPVITPSMSGVGFSGTF